MPSVQSPELPSASPDKKAKKGKKKRSREEDAAGDGERKHKRSKSIAPEGNGDEPVAEARDASNEVNAEEKKKKKKEKKEKKKEREQAEHSADEAAEKVKSKKHNKDKAKAEAEEETRDATSPVDEPDKKKKKKSKSQETPEEREERRRKKKEEKKRLKSQDRIEATPPPEPATEGAMDVDVAAAAPQKTSSSSSHVYQPADIPLNPTFPFFTQTVSLYEPIFPLGWDQPVSSCEQQHLKHLQNRYVPALRGVLMDYKNVCLGENPGRAGAATDDDMPSTVLSKGEYAVGFGWITADVDLFVPARGAWMEGSINLQTEGHIGVICFGKFNASIEARRLLPSWRWVPDETPNFDEGASVITADDHGVMRQIHSTGYWADGDGEKVKGKIRFRIRNFDVGISGETSFLSLEGTMLDKKAEKELVKEEAERAKSRKGKQRGPFALRRRVPDFSLTTFSVEEERPEDKAADVHAQEKQEALMNEEAAEEL